MAMFKPTLLKKAPVDGGNNHVGASLENITLPYEEWTYNKDFVAEVGWNLNLGLVTSCFVVDVIKLFGGNLDSPKLRNRKTFVLMSEPALKCENNVIVKQIYTLKLFIAFKMAYSSCFSLGGNLDFPEFLQKSFITSTTGQKTCMLLAKMRVH